MTVTCLEKRLRALRYLEPDDFEVLRELMEKRHKAERGELVLLENQTLHRTRVLIDGWAFRYHSLADGSRQILNFLIPGDIVNFFAVIMARSDCGVEAITPAEFAYFPAADLVDALGSSPRLILSMSWIAAQSERMLDEQITRLGRKNSKRRMAHLLVELNARLKRSGFDETASRRLPLTQTLLADALGMSIVHANRSFRALVKEGLIARENGDIRLLDVRRLSDLAGFDSNYLEEAKIPSATRSALSKC